MAGRGYLLDTNVVSETRRTRAHPSVMAFLASIDPSNLFISVLTMGELRKGVEIQRRSSPNAARDLEDWVDKTERDFGDRILPVDVISASRWGRLSAVRSVPVIDTLIGATASTRGLILVTRNLKDFASSEVELLNPWTPTA